MREIEVEAAVALHARRYEDAESSGSANSPTDDKIGRAEV
jgi:hypothetical protein